MPLFTGIVLHIQDIASNVTYNVGAKWYSTIKDIKDSIHKLIQEPVSHLYLFHPSRNTRLSNETTLHDLGIDSDGGVLRLAIMNARQANAKHLIVPFDLNQLDQSCKELVSAVALGLKCDRTPAKTDVLDCTGGVYFMKSSAGHHLAVFKPSDEEQGMPNNPKNYSGNGEQGLRPFLKPGQGYLRETAAYIMDVGNFCKVPPTCVIHCEHPTFHYPTNGYNGKTLVPKIGSLQTYINATDSFENIGDGAISTFELQKIAILDIRLLNSDRNASNILANRKYNSNQVGRSDRSYSVTSEQSFGTDDFFTLSTDVATNQQDQQHNEKADEFELIPIDHGYCVPTKLQINDYDWAWFNCPHVSRPVHPKIKAYLNSIDLNSILSQLSDQLSIGEDEISLLRIVHKLLVDGVNSGLTIKDIALLIARTEEDIPSPLENVIIVAEDNAHRAIEMRSGRLNSRIMREFNSNAIGSSLRKRNNEGVYESVDNERERSTSEAPMYIGSDLKGEPLLLKSVAYSNKFDTVSSSSQSKVAGIDSNNEETDSNSFKSLKIHCLSQNQTIVHSVKPCMMKVVESQADLSGFNHDTVHIHLLRGSNNNPRSSNVSPEHDIVQSVNNNKPALCREDTIGSSSADATDPEDISSSPEHASNIDSINHALLKKDRYPLHFITMEDAYQSSESQLSPYFVAELSDDEETSRLMKESDIGSKATAIIPVTRQFFINDLENIPMRTKFSGKKLKSLRSLDYSSNSTQHTTSLATPVKLKSASDSPKCGTCNRKPISSLTSAISSNTPYVYILPVNFEGRKQIEDRLFSKQEITSLDTLKLSAKKIKPRTTATSESIIPLYFDSHQDSKAVEKICPVSLSSSLVSDGQGGTTSESSISSESPNSFDGLSMLSGIFDKRTKQMDYESVLNNYLPKQFDNFVDNCNGPTLAKFCPAAIPVVKDSSKSNNDLDKSVSLTRVATFSSFDSPPIYNMELTDRQIAMLYRERRKITAMSQEFQRLRISFAFEGLSSLMAKGCKRKDAIA